MRHRMKETKKRLTAAIKQGAMAINAPSSSSPLHKRRLLEAEMATKAQQQQQQCAIHFSRKVVVLLLLKPDKNSSLSLSSFI